MKKFVVTEMQQFPACMLV